MILFNDASIIAGYIKQLLKSFNLPTCRVYSKINAQYYARNGKENIDIIYSNDDVESSTGNSTNTYYIKDGYISKYIKTKTSTDSNIEFSTWKPLQEYNFNQCKCWYTKNLNIKNNIYDTETHEYLGEYLRFLRDYADVNLMLLYNCFSNKLCTNINLKFNIAENSEVSFRSSSVQNSNYRIYMIPVKFFKTYTVAIDCDSPVEMCCVFYGQYLNENLTNLCASKTYKKYNSLKFNSPVLFDKIAIDSAFIKESKISDSEKTKLIQHEQDLHLLIKLPATNKSSIVVLEGNYLRWNDKLVSFNTTREGSSNANLSIKKNHTITNMENLSEIVTKNKPIGGIISADKFYRFHNFKPITELQLLRYNTKLQHPFADRLIEYLIGNAITNLDETGDNIVRVQTAVAANTNNKISDFVDYKQSGIWDPRLNVVLYNSMQKLKPKKLKAQQNASADTTSASDTYSNDKIALEKNHDILGFADKDVENLYTFFDGQKNVTLSNIDIYDNIYLDDK